MGVDAAIDITTEERQTVLALLQRHLPGTAAWVYGSRVKWTSRPQSDLDLVVFATPEQRPQVGDLREAFEESNLPFRVDLFVWDDVPESFREQIAMDHVVLAKRGEISDGAGYTSRTDGTESRTRQVVCEANVTRSSASIWPIMSLSEVGVSLVDCEHRTPPSSENGYPYVGIPQIKDGRIDLNDVRHITPEHFLEWTRKANPQPFDIVLSRRCNPGETGFVPPGLHFALGQNLVLLRSDGEKVLKPFLRWLVRSPQWWTQVGKFINVGAVFDSLKCADIPGFRLAIAPLSEQRAIAHILGTLDDKIELNRRRNATLEAMARALFRSWFVDFEPVRAKMEGRDAGLPPRIAALFPDQIVDSKTGRIPDGWERASLSEVAEQRRRTVLPPADTDGTPYIGLEHMPRNRIALSTWGTSHGVASNKLRFEQGDILFGKLRPYFHKAGIAPVDGICSTDIVVIAPRERHWFGFVVGHVSSAEFVHYTDAGSTGTKMPRTNWVDMARYELVVPPGPVAAAFNEIVEPLLNRIIAQIHESRRLAALRDLLLPKLVSGRFRVTVATTA